MFMNNFNVSAEKIKNITLIGDSITEGYGLSENELNYGDYLAEYFDANVDNFAVSGLTTEGQLEKLNEVEIKDSIKNADIICLSIGGNDLIDIIEEAFRNNGTEGLFAGNGNDFNISVEFVQNFIMNYSSAFGSASVNAGTNIEEITNKLNELNPNAEIIIQTIYIPFESSNEKWNLILNPLKTFSSMFIGDINSFIKNSAPNIADIYLKFSEKPYLYTNIDKYDIHPNYLGHMLIAEEIIQTLGIPGDYSIFKTTADELPHGIFSELPEYISDELDNFAAGHMRRGTLEQSIERFASANAETNNKNDDSDQSENTINIEVSEQSKQTEKTDKKDSERKSFFSRISLVIGVSIILFITAFRYIKKRRKH